MCVQFFLKNPFYPPLQRNYHRFCGTYKFPLYSIASSVVPVVYPINYLVIYFIIRIIFTKEYRFKRLKTQAYLLNHPYKIRVILAVWAQATKAIYYFYI